MNKYKKTRFEYVHSFKDNKTKKGYNYRENGNILKRTVSSYFYTEEKREIILNKFSEMFAFVIDTVKHIRKQYIISVEKNDIDIN